eukprot:TRINITY_DN96872_c0_g1_i1.p1 TRINITY_DN96872_c0_g1~~TRINITY_DN96872_c0_g1_i1.p1  ORF type:complete len:234 (-),score=36.47 TRINITY_DN96872_c0_g1_i1:94-753(-)
MEWQTFKKLIALFGCGVAFAEIVLAAIWGHIIGCAFGAIVVTAHCQWWRRKTAVQRSYVSINDDDDGKITPKGRCRKIIDFLFWSINLWVGILLIIHVISPNPSWPSFADVPACAPESHNCYNRTKAYSLPVEVMGDKATQWVHNQTHVLDKKNGAADYYAHGRIVTFFFGFADDFVVHVTGNASHSALLAYSRSRIGTADLGANSRRLDGFFADMDSA